jgi:hypothetical protein
MGDSRRFDMFAKLVKRNFNPRQYKFIADIAGGQGYLQLALKENGFENVLTFDVRRNRLRKLNYRTRFFDESIRDEFDLIVGMHPDEATDVIIAEAAKRKIPFVICPCCIKPTATVFWGSHAFGSWFDHLKRFAMKLGFICTEEKLPMNGKSWCLIGRYAN